MGDMIKQLDTYVTKGSTLTLYSKKPLSERRLELEDRLENYSLNNLKIESVYGNPCIRKELELLPIELYDSILILADEDLESDMTMVDSRSITSLLIIRDIRDKRRQRILEKEGPRALRNLTKSKSPSLISEILDSHTRGKYFDFFSKEGLNVWNVNSRIRLLLYFVILE